MKYCIIGKGFIYPRHEKSIKETGGEIVLTCDIDPSKQADFTNWEEMFESPKFSEVDTVVICTPNYLHAPIAHRALAKGKKVLCEKPLSINGVDGLDGVNTVLQLRLNKNILELKNNIESDKKYEVEIVSKMFRDNKYWDSWKGDNKLSGGILYNLGIHYIDLLVFLLGDKYKILKSKIGKKKATGEIDFNGSIAKFNIETIDNKDGSERFISIYKPNEWYRMTNLSNQENLSYEDLHIEVYKKFIKGEGVPLAEAKKSLQLVNDLLKFNEG